MGETPNCATKPEDASMEFLYRFHITALCPRIAGQGWACLQDECVTLSFDDSTIQVGPSLQELFGLEDS